MVSDVARAMTANISRGIVDQSSRFYTEGELGKEV
jgi:hypothetical protein